MGTGGNNKHEKRPANRSHRTLNETSFDLQRKLNAKREQESASQSQRNPSKKLPEVLLARLLILSSAKELEVLPALEFLRHQVKVIPAEPARLVNAPESDVIFVDARTELSAAKSLCRILRTTGIGVPLFLVVSEAALVAVSSEWEIDDLIITTASPAELDARLRLNLSRKETGVERVSASGIVIDEANYSAKVKGRTLDLTFKEFELLRFLVAHPSRVFTREQLLTEVWGYDYFGGTRTVDVHVRRLRAKLGDLESVIGTVRNVGYRLNVYEEDEIDRGVQAFHS